MDPGTRKSKTSLGRSQFDQFGYSVAIDGDYAMVGANEEDEDSLGNPVLNAGAVFVYKNVSGKWIQVQKLVGDDRHIGDDFGFSVAISGDYMIVGAPNEDYDTSGSNYLSAAGSAYIFKKISGVWVQVQKIVSSDRYTNDQFGSTVSISSNYAIVGARLEDEDVSGSNTLATAGAAYIFQIVSGVWVQNCKIVASDRTSGNMFGVAVTMNDTFAIVGATSQTRDASGANPLNGAGAAYIFKNVSGTWTQSQKITPSDRAAQDYFGISMCISGRSIIIGSYGNFGGAYIYKYTTTWKQSQKLVAKDKALGDYFSFSVSMNGDYAIVGAYSESQDTSNSNTKNDAGSAYMFKNISGTWVQIKKLVSKDRTALDNFGWSVSISGDYVISGAIGEDEDTAGLNFVSGAGSAYIFKNNSGSWVQHTKVIGYSYSTDDNFGHSVDMDTGFAIIGAPNEDEDQNETDQKLNAGAAYIYKNISGNWTRVQKLVASDRSNADNFGSAVSIRGNYAFVCAAKNDFDSLGNDSLYDAGAVYIFKNIAGIWTQVQKVSAKDRGKGDEFGSSVSIHDNLAIIGAVYEAEDENGSNTVAYAGSAYIFKNISGVWVQIQKIVGSDRMVNDAYGFSVEITPDYAFVGAHYASKDTSGLNTLTGAGKVYIYKYQGNKWVQTQKVCSSDRGYFDNFGYSLAVSGNHLIVGARSKNSATGAAYILKNISGYWTHIQKLYSTDSSKSDYFGQSVAINGDYAVVSSGLESEGLKKNAVKFAAGAAYVFRKTAGNEWRQIQKLVAFDRDTEDYFGNYITMNDRYILCGAPFEDEDSAGGNSLSGSGSVYFFYAPVCDTFTTKISLVACNSYKSPSGKYKWTNSGMYLDTLMNFRGCDSIIQIALKVIKNSSSLNYISACYVYKSPSGKYDWIKSGSYSDTIKNSEGCDSLIKIILTIHDRTYQIMNIVTCNRYLSPSSKYLWTKSGIYNDTVQNINGCDSVITINLGIKKETSASISPGVCYNYSSPSSKYNWTKSGVYMDTVPNIAGCDSVITINLTINKATFETISPIVCYKYKSPSEKYEWTVNGTYYDTIVNFVGCDSILTINLSIKKATSAAISPSVCNKYVSPSTRYVWTTSGIYKDTLQNQIGCDSIISINLTVNKIDISVMQKKDTLKANLAGAFYRWLDCNNNYQPISGATNQTYIATTNGLFAVEVSKNACIDTSECYNVNTIGLSNPLFPTIGLYPNPATGIMHLTGLEDEDSVFIEIIDMIGQVVVKPCRIYNSEINVSNLPQGIYIINIVCKEIKQSYKVIKE